MDKFGKANIEKLSPVEKEIYRYIVNNVDKIPYMRVRDIAENSHTSPTSVFRFINKLGYESFSEFRYSFKHQFSSKVENEVFEDSVMEQLNLINRESFSKDLSKQVKKISQKIHEADTIIFFGMGSSGAIASYTARKCANFGYNAISIEDPTYPLSSHFHHARKKVLIIFSTSGETKEILELLACLEQRASVYCCCITPNYQSKIAMECDDVIPYALKNYQRKLYLDFSTQLPALFISELILKSL